MTRETIMANCDLSAMAISFESMAVEEDGSFFSQLGVLWCRFWSLFRSLEALGRRWGTIFDAPKRFGRPKVPQEAPTPK